MQALVGLGWDAGGLYSKFAYCMAASERWGSSRAPGCGAREGEVAGQCKKPAPRSVPVAGLCSACSALVPTFLRWVCRGFRQTWWARFSHGPGACLRGENTTALCEPRRTALQGAEL